jgi:hypothetical protein
MKKSFILGLFVAASFVACKNNSTEATAPAVDTTAVAPTVDTTATMTVDTTATDTTAAH